MSTGTSSPVESYPGSPGPDGTFDQGGNAKEWTEGDVGVLENRIIRGGNPNSPPEDLGADDVSNLDYDDPWHEGGWVSFRVASLEEGVGGSECGDDVCESPENALTCPQDCPDVCGDGLCSGLETVSNCWPDCGVCGDAACDPSENQSTCATDCTPICGDGPGRQRAVRGRLTAGRVLHEPRLRRRNPVVQRVDLRVRHEQLLRRLVHGEMGTLLERQRVLLG